VFSIQRENELAICLQYKRKLSEIEQVDYSSKESEVGNKKAKNSKRMWRN
jgi:hypothetical protein